MFSLDWPPGIYIDRYIHVDRRTTLVQVLIKMNAVLDVLQ